jgi:hypothetical protein
MINFCKKKMHEGKWKMLEMHFVKINRTAIPNTTAAFINIFSLFLHALGPALRSLMYVISKECFRPVGKPCIHRLLELIVVGKTTVSKASCMLSEMEIRIKGTVPKATLKCSSWSWILNKWDTLLEMLLLRFMQFLRGIM